MNSLPFDLIQNQDCKYPYVFSHAVKKNNVAVPKPAWLIFDTVNKLFSYDVTNPADVGTYVIETTATY